MSIRDISKSLIDAAASVYKQSEQKFAEQKKEYVQKVVEARKAHTVPKTEKEKQLAALAEPKDKITHADVMTGRGVRKEEVEEVEEMSSKEKMKRGLYNKEETKVEEAKDTPGQEHMCAVHVKHEKLGEGTTITTQHAEPDEQGNIAWYDVMFESGIERVATEELEILFAESHMHSKKKGK